MCSEHGSWAEAIWKASFPQDLADEQLGNSAWATERDPDCERVNGFRGPLGKEQIGLVNFRGQTRTGG